MFTGLISHIGSVRQFRRISDAALLTINAPLDFLSDVKIGDSISVNGACLTVVSIDDESFSVDVSPETLSRTTIGKWETGRKINLEKSLKANDRLGGHFVLGHIDGVGQLKSSLPLSNCKQMTFECGSEMTKMIIPKGSIAIDGVSLTIVERKENSFSVAVIPHTLKSTTLGNLLDGDYVNIELDVLARYVYHLITNFSSQFVKEKFGYDVDKLREEGF